MDCGFQGDQLHLRRPCKPVPGFSADLLQLADQCDDVGIEFLRATCAGVDGMAVFNLLEDQFEMIGHADAPCGLMNTVPIAVRQQTVSQALMFSQESKKSEWLSTKR